MTNAQNKEGESQVRYHVIKKKPFFFFLPQYKNQRFF
jgi:hypothetical protein